MREPPSQHRSADALALADMVAEVLTGDPRGLPLVEIARRLERRRDDLRRTLVEDARFLCRGRTRGRRWLLVAEMPRSGPHGRMGTNLPAALDSGAARGLPGAHMAGAGGYAADELPPAWTLAWTVGFFEGAGSFINNKGPVVKAAQAQREPLERLRAFYGGSIQPRRRQAPRKDQWEWRVSGRRARALMQDLAPLLSPRRRSQIEDVLAKGKA